MVFFLGFGVVGFLGLVFFKIRFFDSTLTGQMGSHKMPLFFSKGKTFSVQTHLSDLKSGIPQTAGRKLVRINLAASSDLSSGIPFCLMQVDGT